MPQGVWNSLEENYSGASNEHLLHVSRDSRLTRIAVWFLNQSWSDFMVIPFLYSDPSLSIGNFKASKIVLPSVFGHLARFHVIFQSFSSIFNEKMEDTEPIDLFLPRQQNLWVIWPLLYLTI